MPAATTPAPRDCPLCSQPNGCAMEMALRTGLPQPPCWCLAAKIAPATLARLPAQAVGRVCICAACAAASV
jgi:hypothetical protein